jgi:hypothetical protein
MRKTLANDCGFLPSVKDRWSEADMTVRKEIRHYNEPAGGWGALKATGEALMIQGIALSGSRTLARMNQPEGFDCPGCA